MSASTASTRAYAKIALGKATNPPVLPIPRVRAGNNVPHSMHKTRRLWKPNTTRYTLPVNIVGGALDRRVSAHQKLAADPAAAVSPKDLHPQFNKVKLTQRQLKAVLKSGGLEGMLLSHPSKHFTPQGRALRNDLFAGLHRLRSLLQEPESDALRIEAPKPAALEAAAATRQIGGPKAKA